MRKINRNIAVGCATLGLVASLGISPAVAADTPTRLAGGDRIGTAVEVAAHAFAGQKPAVVYVAGGSNRNLVDATTAGKLADGPLLYAPNDPAGAATLGAKLAKNPIFSGVKRVVAVGGNASVHEGIVKSLASSLKTTQVSRLSGADRYETSVAIAKHALAQAKAGNQAYATMLGKGGQARAVYLANGGDNHLVDSMVAGTLGDGPTILTRPDGSLPETAKTLLAEAKPANVTGLGGSSAISDAAVHQAATIAGTKNVSRLGGADRFATAAEIAKRYTQVYGAPTEVYVAGSGAAPDAIIGGQLKRGPILLVAPNGTTPTATTQALQAISKATGGKTKILGLGGKNTLPDQALKTATNPGTPTKPTEKKPQPTTSPTSPSSSSGGYSGGSSGSGSSSAGSGSESSTPAPKPEASATPGTGTLKAATNPSTDITVTIGGVPAAGATVKGIRHKSNKSTDKFKVAAKADTKGVFTVTVDDSTLVGDYEVTFNTGDGREVKATVKVVKKHSNLPELTLLDSTGKVKASGYANFAKIDVTSPTWQKLAAEIKEQTGRKPDKESFEYVYTSEGSSFTDQQLAGFVSESDFERDYGTFRTIILPDMVGKNLKVKVRVKGGNGYEPSEYTNEVSLQIVADPSSGTDPSGTD